MCFAGCGSGLADRVIAGRRAGRRRMLFGSVQLLQWCGFGRDAPMKRFHGRTTRSSVKPRMTNESVSMMARAASSPVARITVIAASSPVSRLSATSRLRNTPAIKVDGRNGAVAGAGALGGTDLVGGAP